MKNIFAFFCVVFLFSCQNKKYSEEFSSNEYIPVDYDTTAIDSFSDGAISVDVAEQIRRSSIAYQDSVRKVKIRLEEERKAREEAEKKAAEEKAKLASEKQKQETAKKTVIENPQNSNVNSSTEN